MKRHISIFALLLSAFVAVGLSGVAEGGTQNVAGGYYYIEKTSKGYDKDVMTPTSYIDLEDGAKGTFTAMQKKGMKIADWGKCVGETGGTDIQFYDSVSWAGSALDTYTWTGNSSEGAGFLAVRFDYIKFDVTFNINGGTSKKPDDIKGQIITSTIPLPSVARDGYLFAGWKNAKGDVFPAGNTSGEAFWNDDDRKFYADPLTAQWTGKTYDISIDPNGGAGESCPAEYTVSESNQTLTITPPTKEGHSISSWTVTVDGAYEGAKPSVSGTTLTIPANTYGNLTLTPTWKEDTFTITYKPGSGTPGDEYADTKTWGVSKALRGKTYDDPKGQYVQDGWNTTKESFEGEPDYGLKVAYTDNASITLYPHWKLNGYKLTIHHKGAYYDGKLLEETALESLVVGTTNLNEILVAVPTNGAAFYGYYSTEGGSTQIYDEHGKCCKVEGVWSAMWPNGTFAGNANLEVWAKWGPPPEHCTIRAVRDPTVGGTVEPASTNVVKGKDVTLTATPNAGYSFCCWTNSATGLSTNDNPWTFTVTADETYTAVFTGNVYTVKFQNSGEKKAPTKQVAFGRPYGDLPVYTDDKLVLEGWYTEDEGQGTKILPTTIVTEARNHDLYANWVEKTEFDVVWVDPSGKNTWVTNRDVSVNTKIEQADAKTASWSAKRDYKYWIKGWDPPLPVTVVGDTTLTAAWESYSDVLDCPDLEFDVRAKWFADTTPGFYKAGDSCLKFTAFGGNDSVSLKVTEPGEFTFYWKAGSTETALYVNEPDRGGAAQRYVVTAADQWTPVTITVTDASTENPAEIRFLPNQQEFDSYLALDAVTWTPGIVPQKHTVDVSVGEHGKKVEKNPAKDEYDEGDVVTLTATAEEGYAFCCWTNDTGFATNANPWTFTVTDDVTYLATFTNRQYIVALDRNGGAGGETSVLVTYDTDLPKLGNPPHKDDGSSFLGYFDQQTGGMQYYEADGTGSKKWDKTDATTLFAQWKAPENFTLTVKSAGHGSVAKTPDQAQYVSGTIVTISATPDTGYAFEQWDDESDEANREITVTADATYVASFTACVYWVTFNPNGGTVSPEKKSVIFDAPYGELPEPKRTGFTFTGWTAPSAPSPADVVTKDTVVKIAGNHELCATWALDVGPVSEALDCGNLVFGKSGGWEIVDDADFAYPAGNSRYLRTASIDAGDGLTVTIDQPGTLKFYCRGNGNPLSPTDFRVKKNEVIQSDACHLFYSDEGWKEKSVTVSADDVPAKISFTCKDDIYEYCAIDFVIWTPEGGGEPMPGDPVKVKEAGVVDGVFSLTIPTASGTDYGVWTNADLTIDSWGLMGEPKSGDGNPWKVEWTILPGFPQLFFRAHKVEYK